MAMFMPNFNLQHDPISTTQNTTQYCHLQSTIEKRNSPFLVSWSFPPPGYVKINTDGSFMPKSGEAGYGVIARDDKGMWLGGFYGRLDTKSTSSLTPELWAIHEALRQVKHCNLKKVIIETDSNEALMLISRAKKVDANHPDHKVIEDCRILLSEVETCLIHTLRQGNNCADQLAKLGRKQSQNSVILDHPPPFMHQWLLADMSHVAYARYPKHAR